VVHAAQLSELAVGTSEAGFGVDGRGLLASEQDAAPFLPLRGSSHASTPLDPSSPRRGPLDSTWRVQVNTNLDALLPRGQAA